MVVIKGWVVCRGGREGNNISGINLELDKNNIFWYFVENKIILYRYIELYIIKL